MIINEGLVLVDDDFIKSLFDIIENLSDDVNDPYHYPVIRVLVSVEKQSGAVGAEAHRAVGVERTIHDLGPRSCRRALVGHLDQPSNQSPVYERQSLQNLWREYHPAH